MSINWKVTKEEAELISKIAMRAVRRAAELNITVRFQVMEMDITACHCNGNPLKLQELLDAPDGDFGHDVFGIRRFIDRETGQLTDFFSPRYSAPETVMEEDAS